MKRFSKSKNRTQRLREKANKSAIINKIAEFSQMGSRHRNPDHVCDVSAPWRAARAAGLNPKKEPLARRARKNYGNPNGKIFGLYYRWDGAPVRREYGSARNILPSEASHLLQGKKQNRFNAISTLGLI